MPARRDRPRADRPRATDVCRVVGATLLLTAQTACTYQATPGPLASTADTLELESLLPAAGSRQVPRDTPVALRFNVPIAGESVSSGVDVRVFSGRVEAPGRATVDLFTREIRFTLFEPLRPELLHHIYISDRIRGLDGSRLGEPVITEFTTGSAERTEPPAPEPAAPTAEELQPLWDRRCGGCHAGPAPSAGLDLGSAAAARAALVGVRSEQAPLMRVAPGAHAESYLLRKLLRRYAFAGLPMPPDERDALDTASLRRVGRWIDAGAR